MDELLEASINIARQHLSVTDHKKCKISIVFNGITVVECEFSKKKTLQEITEVKDCNICFNKQKVCYKLGCFCEAYYCKDCIDKWLDINDSCPLCRE